MRLFPLAVLLLALGCADAPAPAPPSEPAAVPLATKADSVAYRVIEASGGLDAWHALPVLRFEFAVEREGQRRLAARHYWDKTGNRYRVEWPGGEDSTVVAIFSAWPDSGRAFAGGVPLEGEAGAEAMAAARRRTINDTYWLLAPLKLFDPGVSRTYVPDSSDAATDVIRLAFDGVGLTPGDQYWLFVDKATGRLQRWTFVLQGNPTPRSYTWTAYEPLDGPRGTVHLATRKQAVGSAAATLGVPNSPGVTAGATADLPALASRFDTFLLAHFGLDPTPDARRPDA